jgi:hypothetical protein
LIRAVSIIGVVLLVAGCSDGGHSSVGGDTRTVSTTAPSFGHVSYRFIPEVGRVEVQRVPELGLVIVDRKTGGDRFFLSSPEAETCLDFLGKRPYVREVIEGVCIDPGRVARQNAGQN